MKQKRWFILFLSVGILAAIAFRSLVGGSGKTADASELRRVYTKAGPEFEFVYTNGLSEFLGSEGEVSWRHMSGRGDSITVTGQLSTTAFARFMTNHPAIKFYDWRRADGSIIVDFRWIADTGDMEIITDGTVNMTSADFRVDSSFGVYKHGNQ